MKWWKIAWNFTKKYGKQIVTGLAVIIAVFLVTNRTGAPEVIPALKQRIKIAKKENDTLVKQIAVVKKTAQEMVKHVTEETKQIEVNKAVRDAEAADIFSVGDKDD